MHRLVPVLFGAAILLLAGSLAAQEAGYLLKNEKIANRQRPGVRFNHVLHAGLADCTSCHHSYVWKDDKRSNDWSPSDKTRCNDCHEVRNSSIQPDLPDAYHQLCIGCHKDRPDKKQKIGPVMCADCHKKGGDE